MGTLWISLAKSIGPDLFFVSTCLMDSHYELMLISLYTICELLQVNELCLTYSHVHLTHWENRERISKDNASSTITMKHRFCLYSFCHGQLSQAVDENGWCTNSQWRQHSRSDCIVLFASPCSRKSKRLKLARRFCFVRVCTYATHTLARTNWRCCAENFIFQHRKKCFLFAPQIKCFRFNSVE